jgi:DeoR/GlpR family transcriptional regulator of sugar metabolism
MGLTERQLQIIAVSRHADSVSVGELHQLFPDVSSKTIQHDLQALVKKGLKELQTYFLLHNLRKFYWN